MFSNFFHSVQNMRGYFGKGIEDWVFFLCRKLGTSQDDPPGSLDEKSLSCIIPFWRVLQCRTHALTEAS